METADNCHPQILKFVAPILCPFSFKILSWEISRVISFHCAQYKHDSGISNSKLFQYSANLTKVNPANNNQMVLLVPFC